MNEKSKRVLVGLPMDARAEELAERAYDAFTRAAELRRAFDHADREFVKAAREFRLYYNANA
jgi:hypothetical protein